MDYLNRLKATVHSVANQVSNALPGNPVTREYEILDQIASAGPGLNWKIYAGRKHSTKQAVAVWILEKKDMERWTKNDRDEYLELLKRGVAQLTRLRHPRLLVVEHPLEDSRDSFAFCTEPIFASLSNCLGRIDNMPSTLPSHLADFTLLDVEMRHGLFQVEFEMFEWNQRIMSVLQPNLDYLAPEYLLGGRCDMHSDLFSVGVLCYAVFNQSRTPFTHKNNLDVFRKNADQLKTLSSNTLQNIPGEFRDDVKMCLNFTADLRPDAMQFSKVVYFEDPLVKTLNYFESLCQMDNSQKMQFFKNLTPILSKFPKRPLLQKVLPFLCGEFTVPDLIPFILPSIFQITELTSNGEFSSIVFPMLIPVFSMQRPYQIALLLLQKMELLLQKTPEEEVKKHVLPLVYNSLGSETTKIQELCLSVIPTVGRLVDRESMRSQLLPKLLRLTSDAVSVLTVRIQALVCIGKLLPTLEPWMVSDQILPSLPRINSKEPGILMAILGIFKMAYETERFGISREQCARSVLPFLMATCVENTLNLSQFEQYIALTRIMLDKVEKEQRMRLQQLSSAQEDQRNIPDFKEVIGQAEAKKQLPKSLDGLEELTSANGIGNNSTPNSVRKTGPLSLEEKKRLAAEQENSLRMRTQPSLLPQTPQTPMVSAMKPTSLTTLTSSSSSSSTTTAPSIDLSAFLLPSTSTTSPSNIQLGSNSSSTWGQSGSNSSSTWGQSGSNSSSTWGQSSSITFPQMGAFGVAQPLTQQLGNNLNFAIAPPVLPSPPMSANPVLRPTMASNPRPSQNLSAFDDLLAMPSSKTSSNKVSTSKKDPFADLLG